MGLASSVQHYHMFVIVKYVETFALFYFTSRFIPTVP